MEMREGDLPGGDLVIVGDVGARVLAPMLQLDAQFHPEMFEIHLAGLPVDPDPLSDGAGSSRENCLFAISTS